MGWEDPDYQQKIDKWYNENLQGGAKKADLDGIIQRSQADYLVSKDVPSEEMQTSSLGMRAQVGEVTRAGKYQPKPSEAEAKTIKSKQTAERVVSNLEKQFYGDTSTSADDLGYGKLGGLIAAGKSLVGAKPELKTYKALKKSVRPTLARAIGEVGNLTEAEQKAAIALLPSEFSTPEEAKQGFEAIRNLFALEKGAEQAPPGAPGLLRAAIPETLELGRKYVLGDPAVAPDVSKGEWFMPLYMLNKAKEIAPVAGEVGGILSVLSLASGLKGKGVVKMIKSPRATLGQARTAAAQKASGTKISTSGIAKAGQKYVESDPGAAKLLEKALPSIKSAKTPTALLKRMEVWSKAYTAAGRVGKSSKAGLYNILSRAAKSEMAKKAPEVMKHHNLLKLSYDIPKKTSKAIWSALKYSALGKMLGF